MLTCHCTVGAGEPVAVVIKVTSLFLHANVSVGVFLVITGKVLMVCVTAGEVKVVE